MNLAARGVLVEIGSMNQVQHLADSGSEEMISLSTAKDFHINVPWGSLDESDAGTIFNFWANATLGNGKMRTFVYVHGYGNTIHKYVTRFDSDIQRGIREGNIHGISIRLKVKGRIPD